MNTDELRIALALESTWTVSVNGIEFLTLRSSDIGLEDGSIRVGHLVRRIVDAQWLRPNVVRLRARSRFRSESDVFTFYPGDQLPSAVRLRKQRRAFQAGIGRALAAHYGGRSIQRQTLYSDRQHGIGGAYSRFLIGHNAVIAVSPDESSAVVNGIMRAALFWAPLVRRRVAVVVPYLRHQTIASRLGLLPNLRHSFDWLQWDGERVSPLVAGNDASPSTYVHEFRPPAVQDRAARILALAPGLLQAIPYIAGNALSIRLHGIEVARVSESETSYPLGEPLERVIGELASVRRPGSRHPLARAHEERWLESKVIGQINQVLPDIDARHIYPQVPSFAGEQRNIIDLLTVTGSGRLVVIEIKASADPDLPFQALDYWIAVERHRKMGDFQQKGYFLGVRLRDEPALVVLAAPLLQFHRRFERLAGVLPEGLPLLEIGINQAWKKDIKILRRRGLVG